MESRKATSLEDLIGQLRLPPAERRDLSMCVPTATALSKVLQDCSAATRESLDTVAQALTEVARLDTDPAHKLELLALFTGRVVRFTAALGQSRLDDSAASLISASINLLKQLCLGYKSAFAGLAQQWPACGPEVMGSTLAACQDALALTYLRCLQLHLPAPGNLWLELNTLYRLAFQLELLELKFRTSENVFSPALTLQERYLRTLLLSCSHPYQYENHELEQIHGALAHWASLAHLAPAPEEGVFLIDIASNDGPFHATRHHRITATMLRIRTHRLVRQLQEWLQPGHGALIGKLPATLVQRLCNTWGQEYSRNEDRVTILGRMELTTGLANAHALIGATAPLPPPEGTRRDDWLPDVPMRAPEAVEGREINISKRGSCIELDPPASERLSPGEVVAMRRTANSPWSIALVRWKRAKPDFSARFGLEIIARQAQPCAVRQAGSIDPEYRPGLLLPDDEDPNCWRLMTTPTSAGPDSTVDIHTRLDTRQMDLGPAELATAGLMIHFLPGADFAVTEEKDWA